MKKFKLTLIIIEILITLNSVWILGKIMNLSYDSLYIFFSSYILQQYLILRLFFSKLSNRLYKAISR